MKVLYYDCFAGISGDMNLGAMLDLGVDEGLLRAELSRLRLEGFELRVRRESRRGIAGTRVEVRTPDGPAVTRHLEDVLALLEDSPLDPEVRTTAGAVFTRLAEAEGRVHGEPVEAVHFHEVGAVDALVDIVGAAVCRHALSVDRVVASPVELGAGRVRAVHGLLPVPAPATLALLTGIPTRWRGTDHEATTPTGAAILATLADAFEDHPHLAPERIGYGVGSRDTELPNLLRVVLGEQADTRREALTLLESNIDDMNPELFEFVLERLFEAGARDAWLTPVVMKRGRPGTVLAVLCDSGLADPLSQVLLRETTTLGVRRQPVDRTVLEREERLVETPYGPIPVKLAGSEGARRAKPEYAACAAAARARGVPIRLVYDAVWRALHHVSG